MAKQISVGNVVVTLNRHYTCYSPVNYFKSFSINQKEKDSKIITLLEQANIRVGNSLTELYRDLLFYRKGSVNLRILEILNFLDNTFGPLVQKLTDPQFQMVKDMYKDWKLKWMLLYIQDSDLLSDREFAEKNNTTAYDNGDINPDVITLMNRLRHYYYSTEELQSMYGDFIDQNNDFPEVEELDYIV